MTQQSPAPLSEGTSFTQSRGYYSSLYPPWVNPVLAPSVCHPESWVPLYLGFSQCPPSTG